MKKKIKAAAALLLAAALVFSAVCLFGACGDEPPAETTEPTVPETGYPEKTDLLYGDALDSYKKTDFTASWIWTESASEDTYVTFRKTFELSEAPGETVAYVFRRIQIFYVGERKTDGIRRQRQARPHALRFVLRYRSGG